MNLFETLIEILSWFFIVSGSLFVVIGAVGTLRFPDFWSRLHAASITDSAGMILLVTGMCLQAGPTLITVKLLIIGLFLFITGPTSTHAVANAALVTGLRPKEGKGLTAQELERGDDD
jgi:multicomponent Na+:H+ antiporter subunit G